MRATHRLVSVTLFICALAFSSCDRDEATGPETNDPLYVGNWTLIASDGSSPHKEYTPEDGFSLVITKDSIITTAHRELISATTYEVTRDTAEKSFAA
jgi:hypothetical protein